MVREERDLGVIITNDLKVEAQCSAACVKANRMLGLIKRTLVNRSPRILTTLYKSLVRPHLEYSTAAWSPHYVKDREMLEKVQRRFTRMVPGLGDLGYEERLGVFGTDDFGGKEKQVRHGGNVQSSQGIVCLYQWRHSLN